MGYGYGLLWNDMAMQIGKTGSSLQAVAMKFSYLGSNKEQIKMSTTCLEV